MHEMDCDPDDAFAAFGVRSLLFSSEGAFASLPWSFAKGERHHPLRCDCGIDTFRRLI